MKIYISRFQTCSVVLFLFLTNNNAEMYLCTGIKHLLYSINLSNFAIKVTKKKKWNKKRTQEKTKRNTSNFGIKHFILNICIHLFFFLYNVYDIHHICLQLSKLYAFYWRSGKRYSNQYIKNISRILFKKILER